MDGLSKISTFEDDILEGELYENAENLPYNERSVQCYKDDFNNYDKGDHYMKVNDNKHNLLENLENSNMQRNSSYSIIDSCIKYSDCGEPFKPQHIKIDFTPVPGVDNCVLLQQKCIDFWQFVNKHPQLQSFEIEKDNQSSSNETTTDRTSGDQGCSQEIEIPALKDQRRPDIPQKAFATKQKYTFCYHSENDYILGKTKVEQRQVKLKKPSNFSGLKKLKSGIKDKSSIIKSLLLDEVKNLCHKMDEWDLSHPGFMEPPNVTPSLNDVK